MSHSASCSRENPVPAQRVHSQRQSCAFCRLIWDAAVAIMGAHLCRFTIQFFFEKRTSEDIGPLRIELWLSKDPLALVTSNRDAKLHRWERAEVVRLQIYGSRDATLPWSEVGVAHEVGESGTSDSTLSLARSWIQDCSDGKGKHTLCGQDSEPILPARVLSIGTKSSPRIKLLETHEGQRGHYVALSHCWGGTTPTMTTQKNLSAYLDHVPEPLPQTFTDALQLTRELGYQYLWIDSLCIIQDSPEDWALHAPQMARVYGNASVTIAADAAQDSASGFLRHGKRDLSVPKEVPWKMGDQVGVAYVRERGALAYQLPYHDWIEPSAPHPSVILGDPPQSLLSTRGWVFQERALSPRTLHFSDAEVGWECRSLISCECSATSTRYRRYQSEIKRAARDLPWPDVVQEYSRMQLTVKEDRLVALTGLAETRSILRKEIYFAGMWEENMEQELLWKARTSGTRLHIAPTWSWASITSSVEYSRERMSAYSSLSQGGMGRFHILNISCKPAGASPFGNCATGANIVIRGYLAPILVERFVRNPLQVQIYHPSLKSMLFRFQVFWDVSEGLEAQSEERQYALLLTSRRPQAPQGILLMKRLHIDESDGIDEYERTAFISMDLTNKRRNWSPPRVRGPNVGSLPPNTAAQRMWNWDAWEKISASRTFRLY